jgi:hypothetical protein
LFQAFVKIKNILIKPPSTRKKTFTPKEFAELFFDSLVKENHDYPETLFSRLVLFDEKDIDNLRIDLINYIYNKSSESELLASLKIDSTMVTLFLARLKQKYGKDCIEKKQRVCFYVDFYESYEEFARDLGKNLTKHYCHRLIWEVLNPAWDRINPKEAFGYFVKYPSADSRPLFPDSKDIYLPTTPRYPIDRIRFCR